MYTDAYISVKSFITKLGKDRIYTFSATAAFFLILSIFPFLVLLLNLIQYTPLTQEYLINRINYMLPDIIAPLLNTIIQEIYSTHGTALMIVSAVGAVWSASKGILALIRGVNVCFNINDRRNYFIVRLWSSFYVFVVLIMLIFLLILVVFGTMIYGVIRPYLGGINDAIRFVVQKKYPISIFILTLLFMLAYKFLPARHNKFFRMFPGALLAAVGWVILSGLLSFYVKFFPSFSLTYGSLSLFIVLMLYLYFGMYIVFICAEINFFVNIWFEQQKRKRKHNKALKYESRMATKEMNARQLKKLMRFREQAGMTAERSDIADRSVMAGDTAETQKNPKE